MSDSGRRGRGQKHNPDVILPTPCHLNELPDSYPALLESVKSLVRHERLKVIQSANAQMILLYWQIGQHILKRQQQEGWGAKVIDRLAYDLKQAFPEMSGFSPRNLKYMRKFAESWPDLELVQRTAALIPWRCNQVLLDKLNTMDARLWYASQTLEHGWSRNVLYLQIESRVHLRPGQSQNNFPATLPPEQSDMAVQLFKDPFICLIFSVRMHRAGRRSWNKNCSRISNVSCWNWVRASPSWGVRCCWKWKTRIIMPTCCSITSSCAVSWSSN